MGRIWGTIYRIRVEIVIVSSEYRGCLILLQYCVCSLFFACRRRCALHICYCFAQVIIDTYCTHNQRSCMFIVLSVWLEGPLEVRRSNYGL